MALHLSPQNDKDSIFYCIPRANLVIYAPFRFGSRVGSRPWVELKCWTSGYPTISRTKRGIFMKSSLIVKASTAVLCLGLMSACTDLKPLQAQVDDLKSQVAKLQGDASAARDASSSASSAASAAQAAANGAQSTANQALSAAQASQSCCDATNEKIDRVFKKSVSK
jgi:hypothetical protein